jgi:hypothetical protein
VPTIAEKAVDKYIAALLRILEEFVFEIWNRTEEFSA